MPIKNRGLVPILRNSEFKLVHPVDLWNWLREGWQTITVWERNYDSEELEGVGTPFNPPPIPQKAYNYWDSQNDTFYRWDIAQQQWVLIAATENTFMTPVEIRDSLSTLVGNDRLDSSALKNLPLPYSPPIPISDVSNLETSLNSKANTIHNHAIAEISGLSTSLVNKANTVHNHGIADIENLQNTLNSKAASVHTHTASNISDLGDVLSGYAPTIHSHEISNITGLNGALNGIDIKVQSSEFKVQNLEEELDNVTSQLTIYDTRLSTIDGELNDLTSSIANCELRIANLNPDDLDDSSTTHKFFTVAEREKLATVESGATSDQTAIEIRDAIVSLTEGDRLDISAIKGTINAANLDGFTGDWYRDRANHTGTQNASTITGLSSVATSGSYGDLSNRPTIPTNTDIDSWADARIATQKGQASGLAPLGSDSKIPSSYLSAIAITETFVVNTQSAMLALGAQVGDIAVRSDLNKSFILRVEPATNTGNWQELLTPTDSVISVNGKTGAVTLVNTDISGFGTASTYNAPSSGNATTAQVVLGNDTRLTDARTPTAHAHDASAIATGTFALARIPTIPNTQTSGFGTASTYNVPMDGDAIGSEIVLGWDTRLTNARIPTGAAGGDLTGTFPNPAIAPNAITYAKMQDISASRILGRFAATTGDPQEITISTGLSLNSTTGTIATNDSQINHNALLNWAVNQHIDHGAISIAAGVGLIGGGDLTATRTLTLGTPSSISPSSANLVSGTTHSHQITGFVPDTRSINTGTGLTGGGNLTADRTLSLANTTVAAGSYTLANFTVDAQGRLTAASSTSISSVAVDLTSLQTIGGTKIFDNNLSLNGGNLILQNTTSNWIGWLNVGVAAPSFTTRSVGTKLLLFSTLSASQVDYAIGIEGSHQWFSIPSAASTNGFKYYAGTTQVAKLDGTGNLEIANNLTANGVKLNNSVLSSDTTVFDYYNEQACTLSLVGTTTAGAVAYTVRVGEWTRTGRSVTLTFNLVISSVTTAPTGNARITGLPFSSVNIANACFIGAIRYVIGSNTAGAVCFIGSNSTFMDLYAISGGAPIPITGLAAGNFIQGTITYFA